MSMSSWVVLKWLDKQTASCKSPYDWLVSFAMDFVALCDIYVELNLVPMDTICMGVFSANIVFFCHFVVPQNSTPIHRAFVVLAIPVIKLFKI